MAEYTKLNYDRILEKTGGFGRYQILSYIWCCLCNLLNAGPLTFMIFGGIFPYKTGNCSTHEYLNTSTYSVFDDEIETCFELDNYIFPSIVKEWNLTGNRKLIYATIVALGMCGKLFSGTFLCHLPDRFGRKPVLLAAIVCQGATGIGCAFARSWKLFAALYTLYGASFGVVGPAKMVLFLEVTVQRRRLLSFIPGPQLGILLLSVFAGWVVKDWRQLMLWCQAPIPFILLMTIYPILESPKWLLDQGKISKFNAVMAKISKWNGKQFIPDQNFNELSVRQDSSRNKGQHYSVFNLFKRRPLQMLALTLAWFATDLTQYTVFLNLGNLTGNVFLNVVLMMIFRTLLIAVVILLERLFKKLGRKLLLQLCQILICASMGLACVYFILSPHRYIHAILLELSLGLSVGCLGTIWPVIQIFTSETIPTEMRTIGYGICSAVGSIGNIISPYVALIYFEWKPGPYLLIGVITLTSFMFITLILQETRGKELPSLVQRHSSAVFSTGTELDPLCNEIPRSRVYSEDM